MGSGSQQINYSPFLPCPETMFMSPLRIWFCKTEQSIVLYTEHWGNSINHPQFASPAILSHSLFSLTNPLLLLLLLSRFSHVRLCATPLIAAHQAPPSLRFSRQESGVGCHCFLQIMKSLLPNSD